MLNTNTDIAMLKLFHYFFPSVWIPNPETFPFLPSFSFFLNHWRTSLDEINYLLQYSILPPVPLLITGLGGITNGLCDTSRIFKLASSPPSSQGSSVSILWLRSILVTAESFPTSKILSDLYCLKKNQVPGGNSEISLDLASRVTSRLRFPMVLGIVLSLFPKEKK